MRAHTHKTNNNKKRKLKLNEVRGIETWSDRTACRQKMWPVIVAAYIPAGFVYEMCHVCGSVDMSEGWVGGWLCVYNSYSLFGLCKLQLLHSHHPLYSSLKSCIASLHRSIVALCCRPPPRKTQDFIARTHSIQFTVLSIPHSSPFRDT